MKKIILSILLLVSVFGYCQSTSQNIIQMTYVRVDQKDFEEFESRELNHWSKVSESAIKNGDQVIWAFFRLVNSQMIEDQTMPTHVFVNIYKDFNQMNNAAQTVWGKSEEILGMNPNLVSTGDLSHTMMVQVYKIVDNIPGSDFKFAVWNYSKPKNLSGFIDENLKLWKPYFKKKVGNDGFSGWGIAARVYPQGMDESSVISWDHYSTLDAAMKALSPTDYDQSILSKSKMSEYDPNGFRYRVLVELLKINR